MPMERGRAGMSPEIIVVGSIVAAALTMTGPGEIQVAVAVAMSLNGCAQCVVLIDSRGMGVGWQMIHFRVSAL